MSQYSQSSSVPDLGTYTVTIPETNIYQIQGTLTLPTRVPGVQAGPGGGAGTGSGGGPEVPSQVVVTINQNGSPVFTSQAGSMGFNISLNCAANDVLTFVRTSSLAQDQDKNAIRMTLAVSEGGI